MPIHRAAPHIGKLIAAGYHVAICDQVSEPGKGLVERAGDAGRDARAPSPSRGWSRRSENNLIVALAVGASRGVGLAAADVTTGELTTTVVGHGPERTPCWPPSFNASRPPNA